MIMADDVSKIFTSRLDLREGGGLKCRIFCFDAFFKALC